MGLCQGFGVGRRVVDKLLLQRLEPGLARDVRLGLAALFVGQVEVLHARLRVRAEDRLLQLVGEFALLLDAFQHGLLALGEFEQVGVALLDVAQLRVVEAACGLLAVAGDERDGVALGEQFQRLLDLVVPHIDFVRDGGCD